MQASPASVTQMTGMMPFRAGPMMDTLLTCSQRGVAPFQSRLPEKGLALFGARRAAMSPPWRLRFAILATMRFTAGVIGLRNTHGATPMNTAIAMSGHSTNFSRCRVLHPLVLGVRDGAVVHALEHPEHVDGREDHPARGHGVNAGLTGTPRAESGTRRRTRSAGEAD